MAGATLSPSLPDMQAYFQQTHSTENLQLWVQLVLTLPALSIAVFAPLVGAWLDKNPKKPSMLTSLVLYAIAGSAGFWLNSSLWLLMLGRVLLGVAVAGIMVTTTTLVAGYFKGPEQHRFMGLSASFGGFGGVIFLAVAGVMADIDWRQPFLLYLLAVLLLPMALVFLPEPNRREHSPLTKNNTTDTKTETLANFWSGSLKLCMSLAFLEIALLYLIAMHYPFWIKTLAIKGLSTVSNTQVGIAIATMLLVMAFVASNYRSIKARFNFSTLQALGLSVIGVGFLALTQAQSYASSYIGLTIAGLGFGLIRPNLMVWLLSFSAPQYRGKSIGMVTTCFFIGQFLAPFLSQPLLQQQGINVVFIGAGSIAILSALALLISSKIQRSPAAIKVAE